MWKSIRYERIREEIDKHGETVCKIILMPTHQVRSEKRKKKILHYFSNTFLFVSIYYLTAKLAKKLVKRQLKTNL